MKLVISGLKWVGKLPLSVKPMEAGNKETKCKDAL